MLNSNYLQHTIVYKICMFVGIPSTWLAILKERTSLVCTVHSVAEFTEYVFEQKQTEVKK